jgi:hypothetical protein
LNIYSIIEIPFIQIAEYSKWILIVTRLENKFQVLYDNNDIINIVNNIIKRMKDCLNSQIIKEIFDKVIVIERVKTVKIVDNEGEGIIGINT